VLAYLGTAAAIGQFIDIPVVIRSLSRDFYLSAVRRNYSIPLDRDFLLAMDAGILTAAGQSVDKFEYAWWKKDNYVPNDANLLNNNNIAVCLTFHRRQISLSPLPTLSQPSQPQTDPVYVWSTDASKPITDNDLCKRCRLYRAVAMETLDGYRDIQNQIQGMERTFSIQKDQAIRRASGLNQIFEYLTIKEQDPAVKSTAAATSEYLSGTNLAPINAEAESLPPVASKRSKNGRKTITRRAAAAAAREQAIADIQRIQNHPCLKWTWGVDMDASDIPTFRRSADFGNKLPHSGYDASLIEGSLRNDSNGRDPDDVIGPDVGYFSDVDMEALRQVPLLDPKYEKENAGDGGGCSVSAAARQHTLDTGDRPENSVDNVVFGGSAAVPSSFPSVPLPPLLSPHPTPSTPIDFGAFITCPSFFLIIILK